MKIICLLLLFLSGSAGAETVLPDAELAPMYEFAREYGVYDEVQQSFEGALKGELAPTEALAQWGREALLEPVLRVLAKGSALAAPALMLVLLNAALPDKVGGAEGAAFLLRLQLVLTFCEIAGDALAAAQSCLGVLKRFSDVVSPALVFLFTAIGMEGTAALISPASALAGSAAESVFIRCGMPLCRVALCTAIAGNLSGEIDLNRFTTLFRKTANWLAGLATMIFTGLIAVQGSVAGSLDGLGVRTAKFAVDSAAPIIGSGVSDAWESYVSGVMIAKNAFGVSGIVALLLACAAPLTVCLASMVLLAVTSAVLDVFREKETAKMAAQVGGVCQMALSLCTASIAIGMILLGAAMSMGKGLPG